MNIGGFQSMTLSDFPGLTAAIVFTQGCNFRCPFCHNGTLLPIHSSRTPLDVETVLKSLHDRKKVLEGVVISGGEPTLQPDLAEFIRRVRRLGYQVKLDTNGSRPDVVAALLAEGLLDYIAMDIKAPLEKYEMLAGVRVDTAAIGKSMDLLAQSGIPVQFRTTWVPSLLTEHDLAEIQKRVPAGAAYKVQPFIPENALDPTCAG